MFIGCCLLKIVIIPCLWTGPDTLPSQQPQCFLRRQCPKPENGWWTLVMEVGQAEAGGWLELVLVQLIVEMLSRPFWVNEPRVQIKHDELGNGGTHN